jgi:hypothetical protein
VRALLLWMIVSVTMVLIVLGVLVAMFSYRLRRSNRVDPDVESLAPLLWLWMPGAAPRLHRRLRVATIPIVRIDEIEAAARPVERTRVTRRPKHGPEQAVPNSAPQLRTTVRAQAVQLDADIVLAARQPRPVRRQAMRALGAQVREVEQLSLRLVQHHRQTSAPVSTPGPHPIAASTPTVLADVAQQLDVLEQAHDEVLQIERANGLADPEVLLRQMTAEPRAPQGAPPPTAAAPAAPPVGRPVGPPAGPPVGPAVQAQPPPPRGRPVSSVPPSPPRPARPQTSPPA